MPVAKLKASNTTDVVKVEEGNESLDTFIKQAIGKESLLSFSRNGDSSVQWIQLLQALDQQELPGWPFLSTPMKIQLQKCDKCSQEFCSTINYRRHIRVHHRLKKLDKDSAKNRDLLGAFWDKLSVDEAKEVVSFNDVALEDIVQARPSRFPISSQELFSILDDASEKTFLSGTAVSMQKYIFDGEAVKIGLETRNLIACTSFLVEQILVKAWLADKEAEALRCQKLLVEEEEAAQRRQAELLERKRQKKLRQKEQKAKEHKHEEKADDKESTDGTSESVPLPETSCPLATSDSDAHNADALPNHVPSSLEPFQLANSDEDVDYEFQAGFGNGYADLGPGQNIERRMVRGSGHRQMVVIRRQLPQKPRGMPNGFHASQNSQASKLGGVQKLGNNRDFRAAPIVGGNKVWSWKPKPENDYANLKTRTLKEAINQPQQDKNHEVLIGSISVTLGHCNHHEGKSAAEGQDGCMEEHQMPKKNSVTEKFIQSGTNKSTVKFWRPVSRHGTKGPVPVHGTKGPVPVQNGCRESEVDVNGGQAIDQTLSSESCLRLPMDDTNGGIGSSTSLMKDSMCPGGMQFNSCAAKAFLSERWKEAIAAEHVKLVLPPDSVSSEYQDFESNNQVTVIQSSDSHKQLTNARADEASTATGASAKPKFRTKPDKGTKIKYIPKHRILT
ncbi:uncharacterized protein LOC123198138 isoform X2 [Mangifera indica]|uniref:uncharacterized protein LOC123198138 isoform X2 n=1 Tax=Mangifera indica TaxID=29780 RepID=UPI001CFAB5A9|nr:uncharacterized protein LOC123198138 isoform X2 [Mangifera indica]